MIKVLFLIHDLGQGGAEKVLVNLVNNMDTSKFEITVMTLFDVGVNRQFLSDKIKYQTIFPKVFPGNSHIMKLFSPEMLHNLFIKKHYDIEVAYLEGPCARIISGCTDVNTKLVSWIHIEQRSKDRAAVSFRNIKEATKCYNRFDQIVCVSESVKKDFTTLIQLSVPISVLYNTNESEKILKYSVEQVTDVVISEQEIKLVGVGKLLKSKGFDRILRITKRLLEEKYPIHLFILGVGPEKSNLKKYVNEQRMEDSVDFLGYKTNPYKYVAKSDLFICASYAEGFSTAATESLIVGTPVCTVEVSGMKEMMGENNEFGVVTENEDESLYRGIKSLLDDKKLLQYYKLRAEERGKMFSTKNTVRAVEEMFRSLMGLDD